MDRGADVVPEARLGQLFGARAAADPARCFAHEHGVTGRREQSGRGQAVRSGTDDHCVVSGALHWVQHRRSRARAAYSAMAVLLALNTFPEK